ncbi:hypothetical protein [Pseudobacillus badius]|uniref:hypothetical protein n=1 Tax=Bacillus badius TaxID=1455 RepID=UPI001CC0A70B|nr:hypothetical protein [Bacillus badius]UAT32448.1 hypothetical protein K7T73_09675 [Bacillus badius]GLY12713.1 hypothetical protein Bbad01_39290 [Bacillus badius]
MNLFRAVKEWEKKKQEKRHMRTCREIIIFLCNAPFTQEQLRINLPEMLDRYIDTAEERKVEEY